MTEQQACTLCGAGGHTAAQCNWNKALDLLSSAQADYLAAGDYAAAQRIENFFDSRHGEPAVEQRNEAILRKFAAWVDDEHPEQAEGAPLYSEGICQDGAAILRDGVPVPVAEIIEMLNRAALAQPSPAPELWAVHAQGPDDLYAAFSRDDAEKHAAELNALPMPEGITVGAVVVPSPWPAIEHWKYLAEQEREHNASLVAQAGQVPEGYRLIRIEHFDAIKAQLSPKQVDAYRGRNIYDEDKVYANWNACRSALDEIKDVFQQVDWDAENELAELIAAAQAQGGE